MKNTVFIAFLFYSSSLTTPAFSVIEPDAICDLSAPFVKKGTLHLSPVEGIGANIIKGLRFHGHYGPQDLGFPCIIHNQLSPDDRPQDDVAALIQRLFPSPTHDALVPNNLIHDHLRKWLTPKSIAHLFNLIEDHDRYQSLPLKARLVGIMEAISTDFNSKIKKFKKNKGKDPNKEALLKGYETLDIYSFSELLDKAILTSRAPQHPNGKFYFPKTVERALLTYMCLQAPGKASLRAYYDALSDQLVEKTATPNLESITTKEDYFNLKRALLSDNPPLEDFLADPEKMLQLHFGFSLYEDTLPSTADYYTVSYVDPDHETFKFSNCGEATLLNFLNGVLFDSNTRQFVLPTPARCQSLGISPVEEFFDFYTTTQNTPSKVTQLSTHNSFTKLVSNQNSTNTQDPIRYRKAKGKVQTKGENGIYEMEAGLDNFLRVLGHLLGDTKWVPLQGNKDDICEAICKNLNRFCHLFERENFKISWHNKITNEQSISDFRTTTLVFSINEEEKFSLDFGPLHFAFERLKEDAAKEIYKIGDYILKAEKPWHPYFAFYIKNFKSILENKFTSFEALESYLKGYLYSSDLTSLEGRSEALAAIGQHKQTTQSKSFDDLPTRCLQPNGKYFDQWQDLHTNLKVLDAISLWMSFDEIRSLNIQPFITLLDPQNIVSTFEYAFNDGLVNLARSLLKQEGVLEILAKKRLMTPEDEEDIAEDEFEDRGEGDGANPQKNNPPSFSLLHALATLDLDEFMEEAVKQGGNVDDSDACTFLIGSSQNTPLHIAALENNVKSIKKLLVLGANPNLKNSVMPTPLLVAIQTGAVEAAETLLIQGAIIEDENSVYFHPNVFNSEDSIDKNKKINKMMTLLLGYHFDFKVFSAQCVPSLDSETFQKFIDTYPFHSYDYSQIFWEIVGEGDVDKFQILQQNGLNFDTIKNSDARNVLYSDSKKSNKKLHLIQTLIKLGFDLKALSFDIVNLDMRFFEKFIQELPLHHKSQLVELIPHMAVPGYLEKLRILRKEGVKCGLIQSFSRKYKHCSDDILDQEKRREAIVELISMGATLKALFIHILYGLNSQSFEKFVQEFPSDHKSQLGELVLHMTVPDHLEQFRILRKAEVTLHNYDKNQANRLLQSAYHHNQLELIEELMHMGIDINDTPDYTPSGGCAPLIIAAIFDEDTKKLEKLLKLGANVNVKNSSFTPLIILACQLTSEETKDGKKYREEHAATLIAAGANPDEKQGSYPSFREIIGSEKMKEIEILVAQKKS